MNLQAETEGVLWGVDRATFRNIIVASKMHKRQHYEAVLAAMEVFSALTPEQRSVIADCLTPETFREGDVILREGDELASDAKFYLVESGMVECFKTYEVGWGDLPAPASNACCHKPSALLICSQWGKGGTRNRRLLSSNFCHAGAGCRAPGSWSRPSEMAGSLGRWRSSPSTRGRQTAWRHVG